MKNLVENWNKFLNEASTPISEPATSEEDIDDRFEVPPTWSMAGREEREWWESRKILYHNLRDQGNTAAEAQTLVDQEMGFRPDEKLKESN